jgi:hypothetical protein
LWTFGLFIHFGMLYQGQSGNPARKSNTRKKRSRLPDSEMPDSVIPPQKEGKKVLKRIGRKFLKSSVPTLFRTSPNDASDVDADGSVGNGAHLRHNAGGARPRHDVSTFNFPALDFFPFSLFSIFFARM